MQFSTLATILALGLTTGEGVPELSAEQETAKGLGAASIDGLRRVDVARQILRLDDAGMVILCLVAI